MLRILPIRGIRHHGCKIQGHEKISKVVDRPKAKQIVAKPVFHFRSHTGLERYIGNSHRGSKIRLNMGGGQPYYTGKMVGGKEHLLDRVCEYVYFRTFKKLNLKKIKKVPKKKF